MAGILINNINVTEQQVEVQVQVAADPGESYYEGVIELNGPNIQKSEIAFEGPFNLQSEFESVTFTLNNTEDVQATVTARLQWPEVHYTDEDITIPGSDGGGGGNGNDDSGSSGIDSQTAMILGGSVLAGAFVASEMSKRAKQTNRGS